MKVTIDLKLLGRRIQVARKRCRLTQEQVGGEIGVSSSYVSRIETGKAQISMYRFFTIAALLQVQPGDLSIGCCPDVKVAIDKPDASPDKEHMYELIDRASPTLLKTMCSICDTLMNTLDSK